MGKYTLNYAAASRKGARSTNEDNLMVGVEHPFFDTDRAVQLHGTVDTGSVQMFCVCDGIGGACLGDMAAMTALDGIRGFLGSAPNTAGRDLEQTTMDAVEHAQQQVSQLYRRMRRRGGCTLALIAVCRGEFVAVNIGDSPIFLGRQGGGPLRELSCRHTLAWEKQRRGLPADRYDDGCLTRYIGKTNATARQMAHVTRGTLKPEDCILICSDGVTNTIPPDGLGAALQRISLADLVEQAAGQEAADNCTAIRLTMAAHKNKEDVHETESGKQAGHPTSPGDGKPGVRK